MPAIVEDLTVEQGAIFRHGWRVTVGETAYDQTPIGSDWLVRGDVRGRHDGPVLQTLDLQIVTGGIVMLTVPPETSLAWTWTEAVYDVLVAKPDDPQFALRVSQGALRVSRAVTR